MGKEVEDMTITQKIGYVVAGRYTPVVYKKDYKERKGAFVTKITRLVARLGIHADRMSRYEHKGNGLQGENKWENYPFLIDSPRGKKIRLYVTYNEAQRAHSDYFVTENGETRPTTKEEALDNGWLVPSEVAHRGDKPDMFDVFLDNVIEIGK